MSQSKPGAHGISASDTSFRRTWDKDEALARAAERETKLKSEGKARYEAKLAGKTYHRRASTPPDARETEARKSRLDLASQVGQQKLVPAGATIGKRGRGAGFYCADCDLTFKDNLQLVEHLNSRQHLIAVGETGVVKRATVEQVKDRLAWLKRRKEEEIGLKETSLSKRLEMNKEREDLEREEKRKKRNEKRRRNKTTENVETKKEFDDEDDGVISAAKLRA